MKSKSIAPEEIYACETSESIYWQREWVDKRKFKGALLSQTAGDLDEIERVISARIIHGWVLTVSTDVGWCDDWGQVLHLTEVIPTIVDSKWQDYEGEQRTVLDGPHKATFMEYG